MQSDTRRDLVQNELLASGSVPSPGETASCRQVPQHRKKKCPSKA
jgi:hypothetical protein